MALVPLGTPARFTDASSNVYGGLVTTDNGVNPRISYYDYNTGQWALTSALSTRDDTGATPNSYAIVQVASKFEGT